jgi:hypothetical protein
MSALTRQVLGLLSCFEITPDNIQTIGIGGEQGESTGLESPIRTTILLLKRFLSGHFQRHLLIEMIDT